MKKRIILLMVLCLTIVGTANAQKSKNRFQGDAQLGYSFGLEPNKYNRVNLHTVNGIRFNDQLYAGIGIGFDAYRTSRKYDNLYGMTMPLFLNLKGYFTQSTKTSLFLSLDFGMAIGLSEDFQGDGMLFLTPAIGAGFYNNTFTISIGYNYQSRRVNTIPKQTWENVDAITIKFGVKY